MKEWTILDILNWTKEYFAEKGLENPRLNAERIIAHVIQCSRFDLYVKFEEIVSTQDREKIKSLIIRRGKGEPLQYVLGETEFYGCRILVNPNVLIPRPETEYLVEKIINENPQANAILDLCTGSGCIAIALQKNLPKTSITATDISETALTTARNNADINNADISFLKSDLFTEIRDKFDVIVSNPPYIPEHEYNELSAEVKDYEPQNALLADNNGLIFYEKILTQAKAYLTDTGKIYFEIGHDQGEKIKKIAIEHNFKDIEIIQDLNGFDRMMKIE